MKTSRVTDVLQPIWVVPWRIVGALLLTLPVAVRAQDYEYEVIGDAITITRYRCAIGATAIPSTINGLPVTILGDEAFSGCTGLTSVTIPNSVTTLGKEAFSGCTGLISVTIPNSVTTLGETAFQGCTGLKTIQVEELNPAYSSMDGVLFSKDRSLLVRFPGGKAGSYTLPNSVTTIGDEAFTDCTGLTGVTIPNSVTTIGVEAFSGCTGLTSVRIPNSVALIGENTFSDCIGLTSVTIPDGVTRLGEGAFRGCTGLTSVIIPNSVTNIGDAAFYRCTNLTGVYFQGNAPNASDSRMILFSPGVTIYYLAGTSGWGPTYHFQPTALWSQPLILSNDPGFGVRADGFGFMISWAPTASVVVEASWDLNPPVWTAVSTNLLTNGSTRFTDPQWTVHRNRFYRLSAP